MEQDIVVRAVATVQRKGLKIVHALAFVQLGTFALREAPLSLNDSVAFIFLHLLLLTAPTVILYFVRKARLSRSLYKLGIILLGSIDRLEIALFPVILVVIVAMVSSMTVPPVDSEQWNGYQTPHVAAHARRAITAPPVLHQGFSSPALLVVTVIKKDLQMPIALESVHSLRFALWDLKLITYLQIPYGEE